VTEKVRDRRAGGDELGQACPVIPAPDLEADPLIDGSDGRRTAEEAILGRRGKCAGLAEGDGLFVREEKGEGRGRVGGPTPAPAG